MPKGKTMLELNNLLKLGLVGKGLSNPSFRLSRKALDIQRAVLKKIALFLFIKSLKSELLPSPALAPICARRILPYTVKKCLIMAIIVARKLNSAFQQEMFYTYLPPELCVALNIQF